MSNLTVRQEYAKAAMQAYIQLMSDPDWHRQMVEMSDRAKQPIERAVVTICLDWADAMIAAEKIDRK